MGFDLGTSYELPSYTEDGYYIWRQRLNLYIGGRSFIALQVGWVRVKIFFDIYPAKLTYDNFISNDLLQDGTRCWAMMRYEDVGRFLMYFQVDYLDCRYGLFGYLIEEADGDDNTGYGDCQWKNYLVNRPIYDYNPDTTNDTEKEIFRRGQCTDQPIPRYQI